MAVTKLFTLFFISIILSACVNKAVIEHTLPEQHLNSFTEMVNDKYYMECNSNSLRPTFEYNKFYTLPSDDLLVLLSLPDYLCNSNSFVPIRFNQDGRWLVGDRLEGEPSLFQIDNAKELWLSSHWVIEGSIPMLYQSRDGIHWKLIALPSPSGEGWTTFFLEKYCLAENSVAVFLSGEGNDKQYWQKKITEDGWQRIALETLNQNFQCIELGFNNEVYTDNVKSYFQPLVGQSKWEKKDSGKLGEVAFELKKQGEILRAAFPKFLQGQF